MQSWGIGWVVRYASFGRRCIGSGGGVFEMVAELCATILTFGVVVVEEKIRLD